MTKLSKVGKRKIRPSHTNHKEMKHKFTNSYKCDECRTSLENILRYDCLACRDRNPSCVGGGMSWECEEGYEMLDKLHKKQTIKK
jgi:hypothetical protein